MAGCNDSEEEVVDPALAIRGKRAASKCVACHSLDRRENKVGPHLVGVMGRDVAAVRGYEYSEALRAQGGIWTAERLRGFLQDPQGMVPGVRMVVSPMNPAELDALVSYLGSEF
jgi:cytochrome c